jgi:hypothetical protein
MLDVTQLGASAQDQSQKTAEDEIAAKERKARKEFNFSL